MRQLSFIMKRFLGGVSLHSSSGFRDLGKIEHSQNVQVCFKRRPAHKIFVSRNPPSALVFYRLMYLFTFSALFPFAFTCALMGAFCDDRSNIDFFFKK